MPRKFRCTNPTDSCKRLINTVLIRDLGSFGEYDGLHQRVHCRWLSGQTALEAGLQTVSKHAKRLGVSSPHALERGCERGHEDRTEEERVFAREGLLVSVPFVIVPRDVRELGHLEVFHAQMLEVAVA